MGVASVSKTVTAVAMLKLWEESRGTDHAFSLDDPFWPRIRNLCPKASDDVKQVTIRQLLVHRGGFKKVDDCKTPHDVELLLVQPLAHKPGSASEYHNNNYYILRLLIEQIGNVAYTPYVKEHVLRPMGITGMETHYQSLQPMCGYLKPGAQRPGFPFDWKCEPLAGPAGWYASVNDLVRFLTGVRSHKVLRADTTAMMHNESLGWDFSEPGCVKNGLWLWSEGGGAQARAGQCASLVAQFPDGIDAVLLVNSEPPEGLGDVVIRAWRDGRGK
jgi:CubicO group peptidase (beta-lactamase class C family)